MKQFISLFLIISTLFIFVGCGKEESSSYTQIPSDSESSSHEVDTSSEPEVEPDVEALPQSEPESETEVVPEPEGPTIETIDGITYVNGILIANKTYPLPATHNPGELSAETLAAFQVMEADAAVQGLSLYISSGFRSYETQDRIYNNYCARDGQAAADTYSARPGHSEHQTGLAFDLNTIDSSFANTAEGQWVAEHAHEYGFIIRYPKGKEPITGYMYEPWHLRYLGVDIATDVFNSGLCLEEYLGITSAYPQ